MVAELLDMRTQPDKLFGNVHFLSEKGDLSAILSSASPCRWPISFSRSISFLRKCTSGRLFLFNGGNVLFDDFQTFLNVQDKAFPSVSFICMRSFRALSSPL